MYTDRTKHSFQSAEFTDPWCVPSRKLSLMHRGRSHSWHAACVPSGNAHPFHPGETCCVSQTWEVLWEYFSLTFPTAWTREEKYSQTSAGTQNHSYGLSQYRCFTDWYGCHRLHMWVSGQRACEWSERNWKRDMISRYFRPKRWNCGIVSTVVSVVCVIFAG